MFVTLIHFLRFSSKSKLWNAKKIEKKTMTLRLTFLKQKLKTHRRRRRHV